MPYLSLENYRDVVWPSFHLEVFLLKGHWENSLVKIESILSKLADASHPRVHMFQLPNVDIFHFDLTCDVIGDPAVNKIKFRATTLAGLSSAVWILKIGPVVSEIGGGLILAPIAARYSL